jgi:hypothetical protein
MINANLQSRSPRATWTGRILTGIAALFLATDVALPPVNLAVRDLKRSMASFGKLGFQFNPQFTDEEAACMIVGKDAFVTLPERSLGRSPNGRSATRARRPKVCLRSPVRPRAEVD